MGTQSMLVFLPGENLSIIILANTDSVGLDDFVHKIINYMVE